jgi:hypothetical protein
LWVNPVQLPVEHFAIGDLYDLMLGKGIVATIKLTALVGWKSDGSWRRFIHWCAGTLERPNCFLRTVPFEKSRSKTTAAEQRLAGGVAPALGAQSFQVAGGSLRYYVRAECKTGKEKGLQLPYSRAAWISPIPIHILAVEQRTTGNDELVRRFSIKSMHVLQSIGVGERTDRKLA